MKNKKSAPLTSKNQAGLKKSQNDYIVYLIEKSITLLSLLVELVEIRSRLGFEEIHDE